MTINCMYYLLDISFLGSFLYISFHVNYTHSFFFLFLVHVLVLVLLSLFLFLLHHILLTNPTISLFSFSSFFSLSIFHFLIRILSLLSLFHLFSSSLFYYLVPYSIFLLYVISFYPYILFFFSFTPFIFPHPFLSSLLFPLLSEHGNSPSLFCFLLLISF